MKSVLVISQYFPPDITAASFRVNDLYNAFKKLEWNVSVVTAYPQKSNVDEIKQSADIHRIKLNKVNKKTFINYIRNFFGFMIKSTIYSLFNFNKKKFDYVIVTSPPLFVALGGLIVSFFKRSKLIIDIRDIWPDSAVSAGMIKHNGLLYRITKVVERIIYKRADIITCVSKPMKNYIYNESKHRDIHVLYNGISPESIQELSPNTIQKNGNDKISIGYAGNIGIVQNLDVLLDASQSLSYSNPDEFELLIIGDGIERKKLEEKAIKLNLTNVRFTGTLSKQKTLAMLNKVDLLFFSLIEDPVFDNTIPSKLFDYMLNNKPIVTSINGEGREILEKTRCALFFDPNDPNSLANSFVEYKGDKKAYDMTSLNNREYVLEYYNREDMFLKFGRKIEGSKL